MNCEPQSEVELPRDMAEEEGSRDVDCLPLDDAKTDLVEKAQSVNVLKTLDQDAKQQQSNDAVSDDGENLQKITKEFSHKSNKGDYDVASPDHEKKTDTISGKASCPCATAEKDQNRKETDQEATTSQTSGKKEPTKDTTEEEKGESHLSENTSSGDILGSESHDSISGDEDTLHDADMKTTHQLHMEIHGDCKGESPEHEKTADTNRGHCPSATAEENHIRKETEGSQIPDKVEEDIDGPKAEINEAFSTNKDTESCEDAANASASEEEPDEQTSPVSLQQLPLQEVPLVETKRQPNVENLGPSTAEAAESPKSEISKGWEKCVIPAVGILVLAILVPCLLQPEAPAPKNNLRHIDDFLKKMDKVKTQYPNQRFELWHRSRIHLKRHLQTSQPTEPVSLILTAGLGAEKTLHCLAHSLANAFSSAINTSVLPIDGASKASQNSDQVKLDIDNKLQEAFEGKKHVAVIHRFEELPPGSTLIFYRYCDHENAAYKKTFLIFTVLLGEEKDIPADTHLSAVEEMVDDHLQKKFLSHSHPVSFDSMDLDKYGGLWSRISHLILPVAAEGRMERDGC